jgi:UPF0755 protein
LIILIGGVATLRIWYSNNLRPVSSDMTAQYFTVQSGETKHQIALNLQRAKLIRSSKVFETYLRGNEIQILQAGTYLLSPSMSVETIVHKMSKGEVAKNLLTILPAKRLDQIKAAFKKSGYSQEQVDAAFNSATYAEHPLLAKLPGGVSLEGLLYPDSFQKEADTPAEVIIRESLDEMQAKLNQDIVAGFATQGLSIYQGVILASIVEQETDDTTYQSTVAQVFLSRLKQNMPLQSNVTANYAADLANKPRNVGIDSSYNTYLHPGLTPGPIGNMTSSALQAVAHPAATDFLYFVAGDDGKVYFSHTGQEHQAQVNQYCHKKCQ